jgi:hypothetical protein
MSLLESSVATPLRNKRRLEHGALNAEDPQPSAKKRVRRTASSTCEFQVT